MFLDCWLTTAVTASHSECQYHAGMKDPFYFSDGGRFLLLLLFDCSTSHDGCAARTSVRRPQTDCRMLLGVRSLLVDETLTSVKVPPAIPTTFCETLLLYSYVAGGDVHNPPFFFPPAKLDEGKIFISGGRVHFFPRLQIVLSKLLMLQFNNTAAVKTFPVVSHLFCIWCVKVLKRIKINL